MSTPLLQVRDLSVEFTTYGQTQQVLRNVNIEVPARSQVALVGESGSGKTTMGLTLLRLHEPTAGEVLFDGKNLLKLSPAERQAMRRRIQIVFDDENLHGHRIGTKA